MFHNTETINAVKETPAQIGWRHEKKTITSVNKKTGKTEQHVLNSKVAVNGVVQEVKPLKAHHTQKYDLTTNTLGAVNTQISE